MLENSTQSPISFRFITEKLLSVSTKLSFLHFISFPQQLQICKDHTVMKCTSKHTKRAAQLFNKLSKCTGIRTDYLSSSMQRVPPTDTYDTHLFPILLYSFVSYTTQQKFLSLINVSHGDYSYYRNYDMPGAHMRYNELYSIGIWNLIANLSVLFENLPPNLNLPLNSSKCLIKWRSMIMRCIYIYRQEGMQYSVSHITCNLFLPGSSGGKEICIGFILQHFKAYGLNVVCGKYCLKILKG